MTVLAVTVKDRAVDAVTLDVVSLAVVTVLHKSCGV
jgi:hypothetical protein